MDIREFLDKSDEMNEFVEKRFYEKIEATDKGFGVQYNRVESLQFHKDGVSCVVFDYPHDVRSTLEYELSRNELLMSNEDWVIYCAGGC